MSKDEKLTQVVNSSGFPLQISAAHTVQSTAGDHGWRVLSTEHAWTCDSSKEGGFIDIILESGDRERLLIVECKRVQSSSWVFLQTSPENSQRRHIKAWVSYKRNGNQEKLNWHDHAAEPSTVESEFCVVSGQDAKSRPMLERIASELVLATESFGLEDNGYYQKERDYLRISVPVVLTTAELRVCRLKSADISLGTGELSKGEFATVPYLRFRKQLSTSRNVKISNSKRVDYRNICYEKENSVFVVNSNNLVDFLKNFNVDE